MALTPGISYNHYSAEVQSLGYIREDGRRATVGVVVAWQLQEFLTENQETITIVDGRMNINGTVFATGQTIVVPPNTTLKLEALDAECSYHCIYD